MEEPVQDTSSRHGLKTWHSPPSPNVDICFVHGLLGDRDQTWTSETADQPWPQEFLAPNFGHARILTYGYDSESIPSGSGPNQTISTIANELNSALIESRILSQCKGIPIIFIVHGLGGLICKRAIQSSFQSNISLAKDISVCLLGIIFMGTPHTEPALADTFRPLVIESSTSTATLRFLESLDGNDETPTLLHDAFIQIISSIGSSSNIFCYFETMPQGNHPGKIVNADSPTLPEYQSQSIISSHLGMTKFDSVDDSGFISFCTVLRTFIASDRAQTFASLRLSDEAPRALFPEGDINGHVRQPFLGRSSAFFHHQGSMTISEYDTVASAQYQPEVLGVELSLPETFQADTVDDRDVSVRPPIRPPLPIVSATSSNTKVSIGIANLPFDANPHLVGRDGVVQQLRGLFSRENCRSVALYGLGGVGLTQVANAFAHWVKSSRPDYSIIWLPAISRASFARAYIDVATILRVNMKTGSALLNKIRNRNGALIKVRDYITNDKNNPYIIILDDAHDPSLVCGSTMTDPLSHYLPTAAHVQILITSRSFSVAKSLAEEHIKVNALTAEQALVMARCLLVQKGTHLMGPDDTAMRSLIHELQFLPLAVSQAVAFMEHADMTAAEYVKRVRGSNSVLLEEQPDKNRYRESTHDIATTWFSAFGYLHETSPLAVELLQFLLQLDPKGLLISLLPRRLAGSNAIEHLKDFTFVSENSGTISAHKLVRIAAANWVDMNGMSQKAHQLAVYQVADVYRSRSRRPRLTLEEDKRAGYLPHAKYILDNIKSVTCSGEMDLCMILVKSYCTIKDFKNAAKYGEIQQNYRSQNQPEDDHGRLCSEYQLALVYNETGQVQKAITLLEHVVNIQKTILSARDDNRLMSEHDLARVYEKTGQLQKAIPLFEHVVKIRERILPEKNHCRLTSEQNLADAYYKDHQFQKAILLFEHVVKIEKKTFPENNHNRLLSEYYLADAYYKDRQFQKAILLFELVIAIYRSKALPETDDKLLVSKSRYSLCLASVGREREAKEIARQVVATAEKCLPASKHYNLFQEQLQLIKDRYPDV